MPRIRRDSLPPALLLHLLTRVRQRQISHEQLIALSRWLDTEPEVAEGRWFRRFSGFIACGEGEFIKTLLLPGQLPDGQELK